MKYGKLVCTAEVKTKDGKISKAYIEYPKGEPQNPLTDAELGHKFVTNSVGIIGKRRATELKQMLLNLEDVSDISSLMPLLHPHK